MLACRKRPQGEEAWCARCGQARWRVRETGPWSGRSMPARKGSGQSGNRGFREQWVPGGVVFHPVKQKHSPNHPLLGTSWQDLRDRDRTLGPSGERQSRGRSLEAGAGDLRDGKQGPSPKAPQTQIPVNTAEVSLCLAPSEGPRDTRPAPIPLMRWLCFIFTFSEGRWCRRPSRSPPTTPGEITLRTTGRPSPAATEFHCPAGFIHSGQSGTNCQAWCARTWNSK